MSHQVVGSRVGAIQSSDEEAVRLYGYGVYEGDQPLDRDDCLAPRGFPTPRIRLDSGDVVWGCQCWWGSEESVRKNIGERRVELVLVPAAQEEEPYDD